MADCLVYSKNGPALGKRDRKGLKSDTTPVLTVYFHHHTSAWYFPNVQRTSLDPDSNLGKELKWVRISLRGPEGLQHLPHTTG